MLINMTAYKTMTWHRKTIYFLKYDLLFSTHGTEEMPRSVVVVALRVSTVFCCQVLFLYDGGGGGGGGVGGGLC